MQILYAEAVHQRYSYLKYAAIFDDVSINKLKSQKIAVIDPFESVCHDLPLGKLLLEHFCHLKLTIIRFSLDSLV